jgi:cytidyltransferase-like protein
MEIDEPWYNKLSKVYGYNYAIEAGYFTETKPWNILEPYSKYFELPIDKPIIQFSGAFYPFHEGHLSVIKSSHEYYNDPNTIVIIHADHAEYRNSKGYYDYSSYINSFCLLEQLNIKYQIISEDKMPDSCSRNFTRLYQELYERNPRTSFCCGADRANYSLAFRDTGRCIVAGRDKDPLYSRYKYLEKSGIKFIPGYNTTSSTQIRNLK